jgi:hypothetical protein
MHQLRRILVIGVSGSGKSTAASRIAQMTGLSYIPTDPFYWKGGWIPTSADEVGILVDEATQGESWVLDGNFDSLRDLVWSRADTIVWLDFPFTMVVWRVAVRNIRWAILRKPIWSGNVMTFKQAWPGIRHAIRSFRVKRRFYPTYLCEFPHINVLCFKHPRELDRWLLTLNPAHQSIAAEKYNRADTPLE